MAFDAYKIQSTPSIMNDYTNNTDIFESLNHHFHSFFEDHVSQNRNSLAIVHGKEKYTYFDLENDANKFANFLLTHNLKSDDPIIIDIKPSYSLIVSMLAVLKIGALYVPVDKSLPLNRKANIIHQVNAVAVLTDLILEDIVPEAYNKLIKINVNNLNNLINGFPCTKPVISKNKDRIAYILFTSGTTGEPKGIEISHANLINLITSTQAVHQLKTSESILFHTPIVFDASVLDIWWPLCVGARLVIIDEDKRKNVLEISEIIEDYSINIIQFTPLMLEMFVYAKANSFLKKITSLRLVMVGGSALTRTLRDKYYKHFGCKLYNHYGPTECTVDVACFDASNIITTDIVPIGYPIKNTKLYILNEQGEICSIGVPGELYISSKSNAKQYYKSPHLSQLKFIKNKFQDGLSETLFKTGDKAMYLEDGATVVLGRFDSQVKINGNRVELEEIEHKLMSFDGILNAAVIVKSVDDSYQQLVAFIEKSNLLAIREPDLKNYLSQYLPEYMIPNIIYFVNKIPQLPSGKNNKNQLQNSMIYDEKIICNN